MHLELVVPGLLALAQQPRLPALELLFARARQRHAEPRPQEEWLHEAFALGEQPLAAGALTLAGTGGDPGERFWTRADPVHLNVLRDRAVLVPAAALAVAAEEAEALCEALNRHFGGALMLEAATAARWVARIDAPVALGEADPLELAGQPVTPVPGAGAIQRLLTEAQMILHEHPVNEAREARGAPALNSLWLWGGGRAPRLERCHWRSVAADDPLPRGLARLAGAAHCALPGSATAWLEQLSTGGRHLAVLDALRVPLALDDRDAASAATERLERTWFSPLLDALRDGRAGMLTVHVPDARERLAFEVIRGDLRRIWRRPRPIERYA